METMIKETVEYVQIHVLNHKNLMPETLDSMASMVAVLGYTHTGTNADNSIYDFIFDYADPRAEPSDKELINWLKLRFFEVEIERYVIDDYKEWIFE